MRHIHIGILAFLCFFIMLEQSSAINRAYVIDSLKITLRSGPSNENKIITLLTSGQLLNVIDTEGNWCRVEVIGDNEVKMEGWVLKQYLTDRVPSKIQVDNLINENKELTERLSIVSNQFNELRNQKEDLSLLHQHSQDELNKLKGDFDSLKKASSNYLKLKAEHEMAQTKMDKLEKRAEELDTENTSLRHSQKNIWFATGALVLLCGLMIGFIIGRQSNKRRSVYY